MTALPYAMAGRKPPATGVQVAYGANGGIGAPLIPYPASITANMGLLMGVYGVDSASVTAGTPTGWTLVGSVLSWSAGKNQNALYFKKAAGGESGNLDISASWVADTTLEGIMIRTTDVVSAIESATAVHNAAAGGSFPMNSVTTTIALSLAVSYLFYPAVGSTVAASTGESGGDWLEAFAEAAAAGTHDFQVATMASTGTISGGTAVLGAPTEAHRNVISCAINP